MKLLLLIILIVIALVIFRKKQKEKKATDISPATQKPDLHELLNGHIGFYKKLSTEEQGIFRQRVAHFLEQVKITPIGTTLTDLDKVYIGASAIIPIFHFRDWAYNNLNEILVYPDSFSSDFETEGNHRNIGGMVGNGAMHRMMILSLSALREGFERDTSGNTAIHEFVHLLDKADGATDGVPEYMIPKTMIKPWIDLMYRNIHAIKEGTSDLNPYAATNEAEFFAVLSEYFFQKPDYLRLHHPELFRILEETYKTAPDA